jgi:UDP-N-acetyl-D-mannosaminuronic acid dehydrogenase
MLSLHGHEVVGMDVRRDVVEGLREGRIPVREPDLVAIVRDALRTGNLALTHSPVPADAFLICVPTPAKSGAADLSYVRKATESVVPVLKKNNLVVVESTVPPGTTGNVIRPILEGSGLQAADDFHLAYCPERVMPSRILPELVENDRVIGGIDPASAERAKALYTSFVTGEIFTTDCITAEFVKLAENAYRDVNLAFANELALMAERLGVDVWRAIELVNRHPRVHVLRPGPGVGGHCVPVDPWFLVEATGLGQLIPKAREVNDAMPSHIVDLVLRNLEGIEAPRVAAWGVAYKGNVADIRGSPGIAVIDGLQEGGVEVSAYDPHVAHDDYPLVSLEESVRHADCVLVLTDHREFSFIDPVPVAKEVRRRLLIDVRACLNYEHWREAGFEVRVLGLPGEGRTPRMRS